jgi:hypothetical protein
VSVDVLCHPVPNWADLAVSNEAVELEFLLGGVSDLRCEDVVAQRVVDEPRDTPGPVWVL